MAERVPNLDATHPGEQAVQEKAREGAPHWGSPMFDGDISLSFGAFLAAQPMAFVGAPDDDGAMWCTVVGNGPGFAVPTGPRSLRMAALPAVGDPLRSAFATERDTGMVSIDFARRRRIRYNGRARRDGDVLLMDTDQVLGNCPKYINRRLATHLAPAPQTDAAVRTAALSPEQIGRIAEADTFFVASRADGFGADASHRGGPPGFVRVLDPTRLTWPDYVGNSFYMTLGNAHLDPRVGLLFVQWDTGDTLQLTGRLTVDWDPRHAEQLPGALRVVVVEIDAVVEIPGASPLRWQPL
jgi:predicted pyridoxine 5'-phosphate oxidase superfamily flavin-nucleotide-binding protein